MITAAAIGVAGTVYSQKKASKAAKKANKQAMEAEDAKLDFEKQIWQEWQDTYGPIEDQLANYYETLTPTFRITQGLEAHEKEMDIARKQIKETLAQRGIATSGIAAQTTTELEVASAEERARIRAAAPMEVAKEKLGFLQVGLGMNPNEGMRDSLDFVARNRRQDQMITARNAGEASGAMIGSITDFAQTAFTTWANRKKGDGE
jgi:hypothetical protein